MEKSKNAKKMPQSLNDRHYRLLQDLSAPPKPSRLDYDGEEVEQKPTIGELESQLHLGKVSSAVNDHRGIHQLSEQVKEEPLKVKMTGRRRLCKLSSRDDKIEAETDAPSFSGITDFDSPQPAENENETEHIDGASEIRDILRDLSSRLEGLSIKKKERNPKILGSVEDSFGVDMVPFANEENEAVSTRYGGSISSSFNMSDSFDSLGDATTNAVNDLQKALMDPEDKIILQNELRGDLFGKSVGQKIQTQIHHSVSKIEKDKDGDVHNYVKVENLVRGECGNKNYGENQYKNVQKDMKMNFIATGKPVVPKAQEREDSDEDDCIVLSGDNVGIKGMKQSSKFMEDCSKLKGDSNNSDCFYKLGCAGEDFVLECENSVILKRPKSAFKLSPKIANMLYPHQRDGLQWLWSLHCRGKGGILGDDMGLGKTMQICGFLAGLFRSRLIKRALVVAPKTLLPHWIKELSAVGLSEKTREYSGPNAKLRQYELQYVLQDKGVLLTTYDIVRNNSKSLMGGCQSEDEEMDDGATWDYMILDEGHLIKNPSTQRSKSLLEIPCAHRIIISGTPLQNNLKELWALFNFCCPDLLGDKKWFKENYENPILRGNDKKASDRDKRIGSAVAKELRERIKPYFLRRLKSEVFNEDNGQTSTKLSKKNDIIVWLRMTNCQRRLYEAFLKSELVLSAFDGSPLAALTILKKICDHPLLLTKRAAEDVLEGMDLIMDPGDAGVAEKLAKYIADVAERDDYAEKHDNVSCKISFILSLLENLIPEGHHVLIFSQTRKMLNLIEDLLSTHGLKFLRIDGTTKASDRLKIVNEFQEGNVAPIFLLTSQVGGLGLTLTRADRVIVVDPAWNPSTDNQSVDRAYRIGQKKDVIVYRLMTCGTVEEKIYRKQIYKGGLFKTATEHKEQIRYFSQQDLRELFSLPKEGFDISVTQQQLHEEHDNMHTMDEFLKSHIDFLETLAIAGVSHHNLLFSKTAPVEVLEEDDHWIKPKTNDAVYRGMATSSSLLEDGVDWANNAFKPKDVKSNNKTTSPLSSREVTEAEIQMKISRLSQAFANKALMSKLPDKGEKIERQISKLYSELHQLRMMPPNNEADLDEITGKLDRVVSL